MQYITAEELKSRKEGNQKTVILDVREPYEYEICCIEAIKIPMAEIAQRCTELPMNEQIVVMCKSGNRAAAVANLLKTEFGFNDVMVLEGGILAWIDKVDNHLEVY